MNSNISFKATNALSIQSPTRKVSSKSISHSATVIATTTALTPMTNRTTGGNTLSVDESTISLVNGSMGEQSIEKSLLYLN
jgi:hypothetical protein